MSEANCETYSIPEKCVNCKDPGGATHYHQSYANPGFAKGQIPVLEIPETGKLKGKLKFYKFKTDKGNSNPPKRAQKKRSKEESKK